MNEPILPQIVPISSKRIKDIAGQRFGNLMVLGYTGRIGNSEAEWLCQCDCGCRTVTRGSYLRRGHTTSCGCARSSSARTKQTSHGMSQTRIYNTWNSMLTRCFNANTRCFANYGGRGITVCARWRTFENFYADMGDRPSKHSVDRIDVDGHYSCGKCPECQANHWPANVRWATEQLQANNTRANKLLTFHNETMTQAQWARRLGLDPQVIYVRINKLGWSIERALTTPVKKRASRE